MDMPRNELGQEEKTGLAKPKGTVKTIECPETGETIYCVDFFQQPAFDHPLLKDHILQAKPNSSENKGKLSEGGISQAWWKYGECPEGTIPILARKSGITRKKSPLSIRPTNEESQSKLAVAMKYAQSEEKKCS